MTRYLLADIGGTHTRVAIAEPGGPPRATVRYRNRELSSPAEALRRQRDAHDDGCAWVAAAAVAGPVTDGRVRLTNLGWELSAQELAREAGVAWAEVINDYQALARALPVLEREQCTHLGGEVPLPGAALAVLGPGTGLGVSGLVPAATGWGVVAGEGGHVTLAPADDGEAALLATLRQELGHVSAEAVLSGAGLARLHRLLHGLERSPESVTEALAAGEPQAARTMDQFLALLGNVAGNLALTLGARGGVYLAGGILPRLEPARLLASPLRERFLAKGRFRGYLEPIPLARIDDPERATLLGLRAWLDGLRGGAGSGAGEHCA
ncbi:MAG: glucokinase [Halorhodospira sp.]